ncbi:CHRD domain-containing protein [Candidatus Methanoperedens nitroreducens]|uniref:CHRD domain-containing protein n=1 Tax=Candidatus Methanoperedens nitratireducens TaxID=1392998 RepID=A0A062V3K5_9EURY|nr:CHRD domain-containing protein [Candidatus Methanoperedens nitroreducens]KCZ70399.1 CHRD domain-containing protein [Candidatus Methanoperedens nitroreducens]MDJ1420837.1 CHRD domain-containing protein [Candidatus Methanoperedens sp.]
MSGKNILVALILVMLIAPAISASTVPDNRNFATHLSGDKEVPPVDTQAQGQAHFKLSKDGTELSYKLNVANIEDVSMAHIHLGAEGVNGPIVVWLYPDTPPPVLIPGRFSGVLAEGTITADDLVGPLEGQSLSELIDAMSAGETYVNVHTEQNPAGEIRGQVHGKLSEPEVTVTVTATVTATATPSEPVTSIPEFPLGILLPIAGILGIAALLYRR